MFEWQWQTVILLNYYDNGPITGRNKRPVEGAAEPDLKFEERQAI